MKEQPDPLQDLLAPPAPPAPPAPRGADVFQDRLRARTSRYVARRLLLRRALLAGALAACFLAGAGTVYLAWPPGRQPAPQAPVAVRPPSDDPKAEPAPEALSPVSVSPVDLEWQAFDSKKDRARRYFEAGDQYLQTSQDLESALRCYAQALDACGPGELEIRPDDNWLVVTLKNARHQERTHD